MKYALLLVALVAGCSAAPRGDAVVSPVARAVSAPLVVNQLQDAAFWVHPDDPARSLMLVTNEKRGLEVHDCDGNLLKLVAAGVDPQYVDVIYGVDVAGKKTDLALVSCTATSFEGVKAFAIDPAKSKLKDVTAGPAIKVLGGPPPLGLCGYKSRKTGRAYVFVSDGDGKIEQNEIFGRPDGTVTLTPVRTLDLKAEGKGLVADADYGLLYAAETKTGVWKFDAEPDGPAQGTLVVRAGEHRLAPGVKGPAVYRAAGGRGYLLVVSQGGRTGRSVVNVYERGPGNAFVLTIDPSGVGGGEINHSSGLDVTNAPTATHFPAGVLAVNDQVTGTESEAFRLYAWDDIARAGGLIVDPVLSPRE